MGRQPTNGDSQPASCYDTVMSGENDKNLLNFIATTVEALRARLDMMSDQMATMATKVDLANLEERLTDRMVAVENRVTAVENRMTGVEDRLAGVEDRFTGVEDRMATKDDLARLATVVRGDFEQVHFRFDTLERQISTRFGKVETDVSRLRSVVYLLVKDKPEMLRLLGPPTPAENQL